MDSRDGMEAGGKIKSNATVEIVFYRYSIEPGLLALGVFNIQQESSIFKWDWTVQKLDIMKLLLGGVRFAYEEAFQAWSEIQNYILSDFGSLFICSKTIGYGNINIANWALLTGHWWITGKNCVKKSEYNWNQYFGLP